MVYNKKIVHELCVCDPWCPFVSVADIVLLDNEPKVHYKKVLVPPVCMNNIQCFVTCSR